MTADHLGVLAKTRTEMVLEPGGWHGCALERLGRAVHAAGAAESESAAHERVWAALEVAYLHAPAGEVLERAGFDVPAVARHLDEINAQHFEAVRERELAGYDRAFRELDEPNRRAHDWKVAA